MTTATSTINPEKLTNRDKNLIRRLALSSPAPDGWRPAPGDLVFFPRTTEEFLEKKDPATGFTKSVVMRPVTLRAGIQIAVVLQSNSIDPDLVTIGETVFKLKRKCRRVMVKSLRPFRGWPTEIERLPVRPARGKRGKTKVLGEITLTRKGDFYEVFNDDARICAATLNLTLTKMHNKTSRRAAGGEWLDMCGFPFHQLEHYLKALVEAGYKVNVSDANY